MSWPELVTAALLGTDRRPVPREALADLDWPSEAAAADPAALLLELASGYSAYRRAGALPVSRPEPSAAPAQALPFAPDSAQSLLAQLLDARAVVPVAEWVQVAAGRGLGVRPQLWASLADLAASTSTVDRVALAGVYGERGRVFLGLRPDWGRLLRYDTSPAEESGLVALRRTAPDEARQRVAEAWAESSAMEKVVLLEVLTTGLGEADLELLELALADRRASVASRAAELVSMVPASTYSRTMTERALAAVRVERRTLKADRLQVDPPPHDEVLAALGVPAKAPVAFRGAVELWPLYNVVAAARLDAWTTHTGLAPEALLALAARAEAGATVAEAWRTATERQGDAYWARAFVEAGHLDESLTALLTGDDLVAAALKAWDTTEAVHRAPALTLGVPGPWPRPLLDRFVAAVAGGRAAGMLESAATRIALGDLPVLAAAVRAGPAPGIAEYHAAAAIRQLDELHGLVAARLDVHRSFEPTASTGEHE